MDIRLDVSTIDAFIAQATKYQTDELSVHRAVAPGPKVVEACLKAYALSIDSVGVTKTVRVNMDQAATLLAWLLFQPAPSDPLANQPLAIISRSRDQSRKLLRRARFVATDFTESAYRDSTGGGPHYFALHRQLFERLTRDELRVAGAGRCAVYTRNSQFRSTVLFRETGVSTDGVSGNLCRLTVPYYP